MASRVPLKPGATPEQALEILSTLLVGLRNLPGKSAASSNAWETFRRRQQDYLSWIDNAEGQLGNFTDELRIDSVLHTRGYWAIRGAHPQTPWPTHLIESEIRLQKATLERVADELRRRIERATGAAGHIAVVDTHLLLHFLPPEQVDWKEVVGIEPVRLFLPITVVDELDELKYTGKDRVRGKARAALANVERSVGPGGSPGAVRGGVTIEVELSLSDNPRDPDSDRSIISACAELEQLAGTPNSVSLVTGDAGMRLRAAQRDVRAVTMPEKYLREPDERGK
ncbi:MAG TPA: PIN domain-containing protein [Solirubrobacteraceae bacterium]|nr:PIN domain-containing protein [Solirubrobacteraceae bacterium]